MITVERLNKIEQDLEWARENADRSAQTRLFVHHVPFLLTILRPVAEALDAQIAEEEEYLASIDEQFDEEAEDETEENTAGTADSESETETVDENPSDYVPDSDTIVGEDVEAESRQSIDEMIIDAAESQLDGENDALVDLQDEAEEATE